MRPAIFRLRKSTDDRYYMQAVAQNGRETWRTSQTYKRRDGAKKATHSMAHAFGAKWNGQFEDLTRPMTDEEFEKRYPDLAAGKGIIK